MRLTMVIGFKRATALALGVMLAAAAQAQSNEQASAPAAPPANPQTNATVGSPLLRDFDLPGTRTTPPAEQAPIVQAPPPAQPQAEPQSPAQQRPAPVRAAPATSAQAPAESAPAQVEPAVVPDAAPLDFGTIAPAPTLTEPQVEPVTALPEPEATGTPWLWPALGGAVALLLLGLALARRRSNLAYEAPAPVARAAPSPPAPRPVPAAPTPQPAPRAPAAGAVTVDIRPWLELEFAPERLVTTDTETTLYFDLMVKNVGKSPARNVRIQARMFNPSSTQQSEIADFFAAPIVEQGDAMTLPPQLAARFKTQVVLLKSSLRPVELDGRALFVPTVAINMSYEFGNGRRGQTSRSYLVGVQREAQAAKMGPFRLDLGPRIYRRLGGRALDLARAV